MIKVDRIYVINNMALAFFLNNYKKIEIFVKGVSGKSRFSFIVLPIGIAYWPYLFRLESMSAGSRAAAGRAAACMALAQGSRGSQALAQGSGPDRLGLKCYLAWGGGGGWGGPYGLHVNARVLVIPSGMNRP